MSWDKGNVRSCARQIGSFTCFIIQAGCLSLVIGQVSIEVVYLLRELLHKKDGNHRKNLE